LSAGSADERQSDDLAPPALRERKGRLRGRTHHDKNKARNQHNEMNGGYGQLAKEMAIWIKSALWIKKGG
jgi:hypothetical protein